MATRLLLRSFRFRRPRPVSSHLGNDQASHHLLPFSPSPPRAVLGHNIRWFGGGAHYSSSSSSSSSKTPSRRILSNLLSASLVSASAGLLGNISSNEKSPPKGKEPHDHENSTRTDTLIAVNILVHVLDVATKRKLAIWGAKVNDLVREGQIWRMATSSLLHADLAHLICNMRALNEFGPTLEGYVGPGRFLAIYCSSALSGSLFSYWFTPAPSVGASDAICGLIGAQAIYSWRHRETLEKANETLANIAVLIVSNLGIAIFTKHRTDHWAHLGGLLGGAAVELFLGPDGKHHGADGGTVVIKDKAPAWFS